MKNLLNTFVFKLVAVFAIVLLVATAATSSCNPQDQINDFGDKSKDVITQTSSASNFASHKFGYDDKAPNSLNEVIDIRTGIGMFSGEDYMLPEIGGRSTTSGDVYSYQDIGGRNGNGTSSGEENGVTAIGCRSVTTDEVYSYSDIGGRNSNGDREYSNSTELDPGGRGNELGGGGIFECAVASYRSK